MAVITWTGNGDGTSWSNTANWDTNTVPSVADTVTVDVAANITADVDIQVTQLNLLAGTLTSTGTTNWSGNFDIAANASVNLSGQIQTFTTGTIFTGAGVLECLSGELNIDDEVSIQSQFKAQNTSTLKVKNKLKLEGVSEISGACDIAENGSVELSGQTHTFTTGSSFTGLGVVDFISGELNVADEVS
ncbi:MAG: hypothetical protein LDL41_24195, partial [Coleofasciculus sp. S288]|nr:hypothetical protein [Coleofasciculus sp. S288]